MFRITTPSPAVVDWDILPGIDQQLHGRKDTVPTAFGRLQALLHRQRSSQPEPYSDRAEAEIEATFSRWTTRQTRD